MSQAARRLARHLEQEVKGYLRQPADTRAGAPPSWAVSLYRALSDAHNRVGEQGMARLLAQTLCRISARLDKASIAVTGEAWIGGERPALERKMTEVIASARQELLVTTYSLTPGPERIWQELERSLATGIRVTIIVDSLADQSSEARLLLARLVRSHSRALALYDFVKGEATSGLHAKVLVADRRLALVGSANLSHRGLVAAHEMAMLAEGPVAARVAAAIDALVTSRLVVRVTGRAGISKPPEAAYLTDT